MQKNILWILIIALAVIVLGALSYFGVIPEGLLQQQQQQQQQEGKETVMLEEDLAPLELSAEEKEALAQEGISLPEGPDRATQNLQSVRSADDLSAIEADLNETNLTGIDAELDAIDKDVQGM